MRRPSLLIAFLLGACTTAAMQSTASSPSEPPVAELEPAGDSRVVRLDVAERRAAPSGTAVVTLLARGDNAFVGRLEMDAGATVPQHRDPTEEYIHVLEGGGTMFIDGERHELQPGDTIYMAAGARVSFENGDMPLVALQVFAGPEPADKYDAWQTLEPS